MFDVFKNEMNGDRLRASSQYNTDGRLFNRLRARSQYNTDGRLFIRFITLIIYAEASRIMKEKKLFNKYTVKELKVTRIEKDEPFLNELSKKTENYL